MTTARFGWLVWAAILVLIGEGCSAQAAKAEPQKALAILKTHCYRCHGQDGAVEGGMNYILDRDKLVARRKVVPGDPDQSPLFRRITAGKMPPPNEHPRPSGADVAVLRQWIEAGAANPVMPSERPLLTEAEVFQRIRADLDALDRRSRRFTRYFSLAPQYNAGLSEDELRTYRNALAKLLNSLSWHPRITRPQAVDATGTVLRIDLRDYLWDANLWNRLLAEYPYGIAHDTAAARACLIATATRLPCVRADWFVATASRPPLYQDLLQLPTSLAELERQLRVDAAVDIQQERVARAGFNGSGIARNNRLIERHVAAHGAYWRSYDFDVVAPNLNDRERLLPDRRNLFAHPLGPGFSSAPFQHAGGEAIFNLPNGLQAYLIVNAQGLRLDKAPTALVSDPKRPDRAVETGVSCMTCHYSGILPKDDQVRAYVEQNPKAFARADAELIRSLYPPAERMQALMLEDAERFRRAVEQTGCQVSAFEPIGTMTLRYEADLDLPTAAAEVGLQPEEFAKRLGRSELLARSLGPLAVAGGTVQRPVWVQLFGDVVREFQLGQLLPIGRGASLPDNTGAIDPLEAQSSPANDVAFSPDGRFALIAGADRSVRLWDVEAGRDVRRLIGHTASVWAVAFSPDGRQALSGGADGTVRLWDVATGQELRRLEEHTGLVSCVAFSPDGRQALSGGYDQAIVLWDLQAGKAVKRFAPSLRSASALAFAPDGRRALAADGKVIRLLDLESGVEVRRFEGHNDAVVRVAFSADGTRFASASDDGTARCWDVTTRQPIRVFKGHTGPVKSVALSADGRRLLSGGSDRTVRLWDLETGQEIWQSKKLVDGVMGVMFAHAGRQVLAATRDAGVRMWNLGYD